MNREETRILKKACHDFRLLIICLRQLNQRYCFLQFSTFRFVICFPGSGIIVGSTEAPSKVFLLFFLLPDWLKLNHLKVDWNVVFQTFFRAIFVPP